MITKSKSKFRYSKVRDVKSIDRGTSNSAGIDFFIPKFTQEFMKIVQDKNPCISQLIPSSYSYIIINSPDVKSILISPGERLMIPSGIKLQGHKSTAFIMFNKSGISVKKGLDVLACVIDEDYQGEIHLSLVNTSKYIVEIKEGEKIIQGIEIPVIYSDLIEVPETELFETETERGTGGFGSTNKDDVINEKDLCKI